MKHWFTLLLALLFAGSPRAQEPGAADVKAKAYLSLDAMHPGSEAKLALQVSIGGEWHINSNAPLDDFLIPSSIRITGPAGFTLAKTVYPKPKEISLSFSDKPLSVYEGTVYIGGLLKAGESLAPGTYTLLVTLDYQACDNTSCQAPTEITDTLQVTVAEKSAVINEANAAVFKNIDLSYTPAPSARQDDGNSIAGKLEKSGLLLSLLLVFLGGLALNLTPCVYPLIPITISYFGGQSEGSSGRLALMGLLYLLGMALTYSVIGVVTALSGAVFGALLQSTVVILVIVAILLALSLSMFGVYEFKLPDALVQKAGNAKGGFYGAFFMGLTMGIVAAPCIGPFVLGLVTYVAAKASVLDGFLLFFFLALGLGAPYFVLAVFSGKIKQLPRSGVWMESVKHIFGFILIGMALYFLKPVLPKTISEYLLPVYMVGAGIYLLLFDKPGNHLKGFRIFKIVFSLVIILAGAYLLVPADKKAPDWQAYAAPVYAEAKGNKKIIIDFYADWCIPCKELDAMTFSDPRVIKALSSYTALKADMTKSLSPEVEQLRKEFAIIGVPTVILLDSRGTERQRITGFVPPEEFLKLLQGIE